MKKTIIKKRRTVKKVSIYFQSDNAKSDEVLARLKSLSAAVGMSESAVAGMALRLALPKLEKTLLDAQDSKPTNKPRKGSGG